MDGTLKKYRKGQLSGGAVPLAGFISGLFQAVGLQQQMGTIDPNLFEPKGGVGVYDPDVNETEPLLVQNQDASAATQIPAGGFDEPTLITIIPLPNTDQLVTNGKSNFRPSTTTTRPTNRGTTRSTGSRSSGFAWTI